MSWKKYFRVTPHTTPVPVPAPTPGYNESSATASQVKSVLPEVYTGHPNRIQRYYQYDDMDRDSDISISLDTIADFCTQSEDHSDMPFEIRYTGETNDTEVKLLKNALETWTKRNDFKSRLWFIFRNTIKNGDAFFLRDPETGEWLWIDHFNVLLVRVGEDDGKIPQEYVVRGIEYAKNAKYATRKTDLSSVAGSAFASSNIYGSRGMPNSTPGFSLAGANVDPRQQRSLLSRNQEVYAIDAENVVHLSLSTGMDINWPFGQSVLEPIYKVYKQKELLEDAIIIYRVQRAPERRVFKIDTGDMPPARAQAYIQQIKNEIHQRRIPNKNGMGGSMLDSAYSPLAMMDDYFFAQGPEGRGSSVETLPGGDNLGEIGDLSYFMKKLARGMRIPTSYLSLGDDSNVAYNDGKLGAAMIQEFRFNKYCLRIQNLLAPVFDRDFKKFVKDFGVQIPDDVYELQFLPPQNFSRYRQIEVDSQQAQVYSSIASIETLSDRFKLKRFLGLTHEEIIENQRLWSEENSGAVRKSTGASPAESNQDMNLSAVGLRPEDSPDPFADAGDAEFGGETEDMPPPSETPRV